MSKKRVIVVGGGASGMMAAGAAGSRGHEVYLLEKNRHLGRKLVLTGKGRCNLTNTASIEKFIQEIPRNGSFLYSAFHSFSPYDLMELLSRYGLECKVERGGRVFPVSDEARDVQKALRRYLQEGGVQSIRGTVQSLCIEEGRVQGIYLNKGRFIPASAVILATGGLSYPATGSTGDGYGFARAAGHTLTNLQPALVPMDVAEDWVKELSGLHLKNIEVKVWQSGKVIDSEFGELTFMDGFLAGPVILTLSSRMENPARIAYTLSIDVKPALSESKLHGRLQRDFHQKGKASFADSLKALLPQQLIPVIVHLTNIPEDTPVNQITKRERQELCRLLKELTVTPKGFRPYSEAIITAGGVKIKEVNPKTMASKKVEGLFFAGELLDIHGYTGGYNLQIAFSTGYVAGISC